MSAPTTRPAGPKRRASRRVSAPVPHPTSTAAPPWRKPQRIDQLIDHDAVATCGALLEDGREAQVWATEGDCAVVLGERGQDRLPLRGRQMEREEEHRRTATPCLISDARYLALASQSQCRKRVTALEPPRGVSAKRPRSPRRDRPRCRSSARSHTHAERPPSRQDRRPARTLQQHSAAPRRYG